MGEETLMYINSAYWHNKVLDFKDKSKPLFVCSCGTYHLYTRTRLPTHRPRGRLDYQNYTSYVFEDICKEYLRLKNKKGELPFYFSKIGRWWNKTDELDIMAVDHRNKKYILGECKYKKTAFDLSDMRNVQQKVRLQAGIDDIYYWIFSKGGYTEAVIAGAKEQNVKLLTVEDVVSGK